MAKLFTKESHPHMFLPADPFPYPFEGQGLKATLRDLLKVAREHPAYFEPTHRAFYRLILTHGGISLDRAEDMMRLTGREIPSYPFFSKQFFGVEEAIDKIVTGYGAQAAAGGAGRKKMLVITGAPGGGKSDLVNYIQGPLMHSREPIPCLAGSSNFSNPLNALYLPAFIASRKSNRRRGKMMDELARQINSLDLKDAKLDFDVSEVREIAQRYGFEAGKELTDGQFAEIAAANDKDFVAIVCYALGFDKPTIDALVTPDPWARDVVLGEFAGTAFVTDPNVRELSGLDEAHKAKEGKEKKHDTYGRFDENYAVDLGNFPIGNMYMSEGDGLRDIPYVQPINFDLATWRGDVNIDAIGRYAPNDPRSVLPTGFFNQARLAVCTEGLRAPDEAFNVYLELLEGQRLGLPEPLSNFYQYGIGWEGMVIIHSNDEQWNRFYSNPDHRAHDDRIHWVSFPYPIEPKKCAEVQAKLTRMKGGKRWSPENPEGAHYEPECDRLGGFFLAATRIDWKSKEAWDIMTILRLYDGLNQRSPGYGALEMQARVLREQAPWTEGLIGMSPRTMNDIRSELAANAANEYRLGKRPAPCYTAAEMRDFMIAKFAKDPRLDKKTKDLYTGWLMQPLEREIRLIDLNRIYKAAFIPNFRDLCENYFRKYLDCLKAINRGLTGSSQYASSGSAYSNTQEMEAFLQTIERADPMYVNSAQADKHRQNVETAVRAWRESHNTLDLPPYDVHEGLRRCIEAFVLKQAQNVTGVIGAVSPNPEEQKRLDDAKTRLIKEHDYCPHCATRLVVEAAHAGQKWFIG